MILYRWRGVFPNFGDELNTILWPRLLPDFFDQDPTIRFLGIGSVLDQRHSSQALKLVAGSGYGGYERKPHLDDTWIIHWVRGPRTAAMLGLPRTLALGDPALLIPKALDLPGANGHDIGFMPHFQNAAWGAWPRAAEMAGVRLIDPRDPPLAILQAIGRCKLLLSEALHGVIVADAMRVPWVAIRPLADIHRAKWSDWADSMDLRPRFSPLTASTLTEWIGTSQMASWHATRVWLGRHRMKPIMAEWLVARASAALRLAANAPPQLSNDASLHRCQSRMLDAIEIIRTKPLGATPRFDPVMHPRPRLQAIGNSDYQINSIGG